jgi:hypothetical protein
MGEFISVLLQKAKGPYTRNIPPEQSMTRQERFRDLSRDERSGENRIDSRAVMA